jgi:hypothetical protein
MCIASKSIAVKKTKEEKYSKASVRENLNRAITDYTTNQSFAALFDTAKHPLVQRYLLQCYLDCVPLTLLLFGIIL